MEIVAAVFNARLHMSRRNEDLGTVEDDVRGTEVEERGWIDG